MTRWVAALIAGYLVITTGSLAYYVATTPREWRKYLTGRKMLWAWLWCLLWPVSLFWWVTGA